jgi:hypothetical protein
MIDEAILEQQSEPLDETREIGNVNELINMEEVVTDNARNEENITEQTLMSRTETEAQDQETNEIDGSPLEETVITSNTSRRYNLRPN